MFIFFYLAIITTLIIGILIGLYLDREQIFKIPKVVSKKLNKSYGAVFVPEKPINKDEKNAEDIENNILKNIGAI